MTEGRRWLELRVRSPVASDRAGLLADGMVGLGARGVEERDGWFIAYFTEPADPAAFLEEAQEALERETGLDRVLVEYGWQLHEAWEERWKRGLGERRVTERIVVHPSWIDPEGVGPDDIVIVLDPGMAFGTAEHGTTRGCLRLLDGTVSGGEEVLDVGAGSGILSIAAARLGAGSVVAVEGDDLACEAMRENLQRNGVQGSVRIDQAWATAPGLAGRPVVDGLIANIETGLLQPLFEGFASVLKPGGWLVVSGILELEWDGVRDTLETAGFRFQRVDEDGAWRSGLFRLAGAR